MRVTGKDLLVWTAGAVVAAEAGLLVYRLLSNAAVKAAAQLPAQTQPARFIPENVDIPVRRNIRLAAVAPPRGRVETASDDSFPASDPPAWTGSGL